MLSAVLDSSQFPPVDASSRRPTAGYKVLGGKVDNREVKMAKGKPFAPMVGWVYDLVLWLFSVLVDLFFREVHPRGSWKVPRRGPVIFVAAPHANQVGDHSACLSLLGSRKNRES
jgi:hypothetical protein